MTASNAKAFRFHLAIGEERVEERIHTLNTPDEVVARLHEEGIVASTSPYPVSYARLAPSLNDEREVARSVAAAAMG